MEHKNLNLIMTNEEAKFAWKRGIPVIYRGIRYDEISALIYRADRQSRAAYISVELLDKRSRCVVVALPKDVEKAETDM